MSSDKKPFPGPRGPRDNGESVSVVINALLKGDFAPVALPKREFMEMQMSFGSASFFQIYNLRRLGMAMTLASGQPIWRVMLTWRRAVNISTFPMNLSKAVAQM